MCTSRLGRFTQAAKLLPPNSVDAVDLNCGCPQGIARKGHYGAFLLSEPEVIEGIVRTLDRELAVPSTVKIRLVNANELQDTLKLVSRLEAAGASVLCLHGRTKEMKGQSTGPPNWDAIAAVKRRVGIPLIANGGIHTLPGLVWDSWFLEGLTQHTNGRFRCAS
ncbi:Dus1l [Symbiodinium necroappetens]|uniref:tRNA-dihydrouridine(16/17) synthase [NAD(P)(+)] n=1 Tax=Symbiodinium necroappetens TaxID=1628268 RepID=A0A812QTE4_9DINO|nr:Dus1l [Symbiodinium necroappetens]